MTVTDEGRRLLEGATPLPWVVQRPEPGDVYIDTHAYADGPEPIVNNNYRISEADARVAAYAVNHLPAFLTAVEALERLVAWADGADSNGHTDFDRARAALAPFTEEPTDASDEVPQEQFGGW